jgi:hypothetical protein
MHTDKISAKLARMGAVREKTSPLIIKDFYEGGEEINMLEI